MTREEIKDLLEMNYDNNIEGLIDHIFNLEIELNTYKKGLETARMLINGSVSKERYQAILKKYNDLKKVKR